MREVNRERGTTVILTTHDMDDIERICDRIIMINQGRLLHDGPLAAFKSKLGKGHRMMVEFTSEEVAVADPRLRVIRTEGPRTWFAFRSEEISPAEAATLIVRNHDIRDLTIEEPEIEEIVREFYEQQ